MYVSKCLVAHVKEEVGKINDASSRKRIRHISGSAEWLDLAVKSGSASRLNRISIYGGTQSTCRWLSCRVDHCKLCKKTRRLNHL
jgi:hypothetical protein